MSIYALVTARAGSQGIPRKNLRPLKGKPLLLWTIEAALKSRSVARVLLSTEDAEIASLGRASHVEVPFLRPKELAAHESTHLDVVLHFLKWLQESEGTLPEFLLLLQPTSPFRAPEDIDGASALARRNLAATAVVSVCEAQEHPYLMKKILANGKLADFSPADHACERRQEFPTAYALNGAIYLNRVESLLREKTFLPAGTIAYVMPRCRSLDIDTPFDFHVAELLASDPFVA